jgi:glucosamine kinase
VLSAKHDPSRVPDLVLGADVGGTATRVGVATLAGDVLALAVGGPGNPNAVGQAASAAEIRSVTTSALAGVTGRVAAVVLGLAGGSRVAADRGYLRAAVPAEVPVPAVLVPDLVIAFCSATPASDGSVLVAGTGAVAGLVRGADLAEQRDGWGWLLGDDGSGFWLGRAAVRATLDGLQRGRALGPLQRDVLATAGARGHDDLLQDCYLAAPTRLARFAVLVSRHAEHDPTAAAIADEAVVRLSELLSRLDRRAGEPVVLAGSVLTPSGPVGRSFRAALGQLPDIRSGQTPVLGSAGGVVGALWLALRSQGVVDDAVHERLTMSARRWLGET